MSGVNRRWVLAKRPDGLVQEDDFRLEEAPIPVPGPGQMLVRNVFIPVDPGMRPALSERWSPLPGFDPVALGVVVGYLTVGQVVQSDVPGFAPGDWVTDYLLWQDYAVVDGKTARVIRDLRLPPSTAVGVLGVPGLSAYFGMIAQGEPKPGETVLVTSAAGAVGSIAGQIGAIKGCRVVGIASGEAKLRWLREELGFHEVIDRKASGDLTEAIRVACPDGVDILFDNVGNAMIDRVLPLMRRGGRVVICGQIADYDKPFDQKDGIRNTACFVFQSLILKGLFVYDFTDRFDAAIAEMTGWILDGRLKYREQVEEGFERLPAAFASLFSGSNLGRPIVKIT